jgi:hypothetical protein
MLECGRLESFAAHPDLFARQAALLEALSAMNDIVQVASEVLEGVVRQEAERACGRTS